ncbi:hypothetical protein L6R50_09205 [Myxococcota bacterium]|nr:hypothetical protein [Myxococcota bacterium]
MIRSLFALALSLAALALPGCATLGQSRTAQAVVAAAASPAEDLAVAALEAELAKLPADPADLRAWCLSAGLTDDEADLVIGEAGGELMAALGSLPRYIEGGAFGRLALSALAGEHPEVVGPREAARFLLAWAEMHQGVLGNDGGP